MKGAVAGGPSADRAGRCARARGGRQRGRRVRRGGLRRRGRPRARSRARAPAASCSSTARATARRGSPTSSSPRPASACSRHGAGEMQVVDVGFGDVDDDAAVPDRARLVRRARRGRRARGGAPRLRPPAVARAARAGDRARARRRRADARRRRTCTRCSTRSSRSTPEGRRIYSDANGDAPRRAATRCGCPSSPTRSTAIARRGAAAFYRGERARAIVATVRDGGGELTLDDLASLPRRLAPARARAVPRLRRSSRIRRRRRAAC